MIHQETEILLSFSNNHHSVSVKGYVYNVHEKQYVLIIGFLFYSIASADDSTFTISSQEKLFTIDAVDAHLGRFYLDLNKVNTYQFNT